MHRGDSSKHKMVTDCGNLGRAYSVEVMLFKNFENKTPLNNMSKIFYWKAVNFYKTPVHLFLYKSICSITGNEACSVDISVVKLNKF